MDKNEVIIYAIEQKFPDNDGILAWYETGEEYKTLNECLRRLDKLEEETRTGFRAIEKRIRIMVARTI